MSILLTDEEIEQAIEPYILSSYRNPSGDFMSSAEVAKRVTLQRQLIAKAQLRKAREALGKVYDEDDIRLALAYVMNDMDNVLEEVK